MQNDLVRLFRTLIVGVGLALVTAGCSTMDDVTISHPCDGPVTVLIDHLEPDGSGSPTYVAGTWNTVGSPGETSMVAGIVNLGAEDLVALYVDISGWELELTRTQLRERTASSRFPEACP